MKILERGNLPELAIHKVRCNRCQTLFEFEQREATTVYDQRDGDFLSIPCPVCKKKVTTTPKATHTGRYGYQNNPRSTSYLNDYNGQR